MVHAKLSESEANGKNKVHGSLFIKELKRLRNLGAPLSPLDFDRYKRGKRHLVTKGGVKKLIREAHAVERLPQANVPKFLELRLALPFAVINQEIEVKSIIQEIYRPRRSSFKLP
ncbi:MAG: hypothetical protein PXY39_08190 [archaeon]|nr:hypothetical protein [archaeon]